MWSVNPKKAATWLQENFESKESTNGWTSFDCPICARGAGKKKASVHYTFHLVKCFVCGYREKLETFIKDYNDLPDYWSVFEFIEAYEPANITLSESQVINRIDTSEHISPLPFGFTPMREANEYMIGRKALKYLHARGLHEKIQEYYNLGFCAESPAPDSDLQDYFGYVIIPYTYRGNVQYYIGRDYVGNKLRYKNPKTTYTGIGKDALLFNEDALDLYSEVAIMEGAIDAMTYGKDALASAGWNLSEVQRFKLYNSECSSIVFVPDGGYLEGTTKPDTKYYKEALKAAASFMDSKQVKVLPVHTLAEFGKDVNAIKADRIRELAHKTKPLTKASLFKALLQ